MRKIHIFGASGSGTSTLGRNLAAKLGYRFFDADDYYWKKTDPPFTDTVPIPERQANMLKDMNGIDRWVLSGSMDSWSEPFLSQFDFVVFLYIPREVRAERLREREKSRHGARILPGGDMHEGFVKFIEWAQQYDDGIQTGRSLPRHEVWMKRVTCPLLRIEKVVTQEEAVELVLSAIK